MIVKHTASDGNPGYNELNRNTLKIFWNSDLNFEAAIDLCGKNLDRKHISDMLHILKIACKWLILGKISLNSDRIIHLITSEEIEKVLLLGKTLSNKSPLGKTKDIYVVELFNFENLKKLLENNMTYEALYFLLFVCWQEVVTNEYLNKSSLH